MFTGSKDLMIEGLLIQAANFIGGDVKKAGQLCESRRIQRMSNTWFEYSLGLKEGSLSPEYTYSRNGLEIASLEGQPDPEIRALRAEITHPLVKKLVAALSL